MSPAAAMVRLVRNAAVNIDSLRALRHTLEGSFRADTAVPGSPWRGGSDGHCAAVAAVVHELFGGRLASSTVQGVSHWFNLLMLGNEWAFVDLTGDQFGFRPVQVAKRLYEGTRERAFDELNDETLNRAAVLARRADLGAAVMALQSELERRRSTKRAERTGCEAPSRTLSRAHYP